MLQNMKKLLLICCLLLCGTCITAQTLFTYGKHAVDKEEFLRAFYKNNTEDRSEKALQDYLDLYIAFKLKVQAAKDSKLDTSANQKNELLNFRRQIEDEYLSDDSSITALCKEAFDRSLHDVRVAHIFIPFNPNYVNGPSTFFSTEGEDTSNAFAAIQKAYKELQQGTDFGVVAEKYSLDPSVKNNKGDIGFITVFTVPYQLESVAYQLNKGNFSQPYKSNVGYHILKKTDERPAFGKMKAAQILLSYPPGITTGEKQILLNRADSLYKALQQGASFELLAKQFSSERTVATTGGVLNPDFSIGRYDPVFENAVMQLKSDGDYTLPFETTYGVHIVQRLAHIPPVADTSQAVALFKNDVMQDARMKVSHDNQDKRILRSVNYNFVFKSKELLWQITDSLLRNPDYLPTKNVTAEAAVFTFSKEEKKLSDWWAHIQAIRGNYRPGVSLPYETILQQYAAATARIYYKEHLEDYNPAFKNQLDEFAEGNQLFEIMEKQVWNKGAEDQAGLKKYYEANKERYKWSPSVNAVFFTVMDKATADAIKTAPENYLPNWRTIAETSSGKIIADSARFEVSQLPGYKEDTPVGQLTGMGEDTGDGSVSLIYVIGKHADGGQKTFDEAKGLVINDYQNLLDQQWITSLKKKYRVKIKEAVLKTLVP